MKNKYIYTTTIFAIVIFTLSSCSIGYYSKSYNKTAAMTPNLIRLELTADDIEYVGEETISVSYRTYLGLFKKNDSINNELYNRRIKKEVFLSGFKDIRLSRNLKKATYKVIEKFPSADYYVISNKSRSVKKMFLGKNTKEKATIKAYKFRNLSSK